jgi:hypothetical protein
MAFAVTVHTVLLRGAVNSPAFGSTVPQLATQVAGPLAVNCRVTFSTMLGLAGAIVKEPAAAIVSETVVV